MNCTVLTASEYKHLAVARGTSGSLCFALTIATLAVALLTLRSKATGKGFLDYLYLYLTMVTLIHTGLYVVEMVEEMVGDQSSFCKALGFFLEWVGWVQLSSSCLIIFSQIYLLVRTVGDTSSPWERIESSLVVSRGTGGRTTVKKRHYCAMMLGWTPIPLIFIWLPFSTSKRHDAELWCWIASISEDCRGNKAAFIEEIVLWYTPVLIAGGYSLCLVLLTTATYGWWACWQQEELRHRIPKQLLLAGFFFIFSMLCGVELAARIHTALYKTHHYGVWMAYAILIPWRDLALPLGYCIYLQNCCKREPCETNDVPSHPEDIDRSAFVNVETLTTKEKWAMLINTRANRSNTII